MDSLAYIDPEDMLKFARRKPGAPMQKIRDAATVVLLDRAGPTPRVLMGKRHDNLVFMPGFFVFPGGRVDPQDRTMPALSPMRESCVVRLDQHCRRPSASRARALGVAAIRELYEETGIVLGESVAPGGATGLPPLDQIQLRPALDALTFIARAITAPGAPRRFDTRFFAADAARVTAQFDGAVGPDSELVDLRWLPLDSVIGQVPLASITRAVLVALRLRLRDGYGPDLPVPFWRLINGRIVRAFL